MKRIALFVTLMVMTISFGFAQNKLRVACVGNSVTFGYGIPEPEKNSYPAQMQQLLGEGYDVKNFGFSGSTLLSKGHRPYIKQQVYQDALAFAADRVVIDLGLNDTDPRNWPNYKDDFIRDYLALIESFRKANSKCKVWICRMTPLTVNHSRFIAGTRDWYDQVQQAIVRVAGVAGVGLIDVNTELYKRPDLLPDALHPTKEGAGIMAHVIAQYLTGNFGGLRMPEVYSDNMVLQRNEVLPIKGFANPGDQITVSIASQKKSAVCDADGHWSVELDAMKAGGPYRFQISTKNKTLTYNNVLVGEVWLCSGQSNMLFQLAYCATKADKEQASKSNIRLFNMSKLHIGDADKWSTGVLDSINRLQFYNPSHWEESNPQSAAAFSAIAYYFGKTLSDSLHVPIGLIMNAIGGSPCESWIDRKTLEDSIPQIFMNWKTNPMIQDWARERATLNNTNSTNNMQRHPFEPSYLYEAGILPLNQFPVKGVIWYQGESNAHNVELFGRLFPMFVQSWRKTWNKELPIYYVQLSSIDRPSWPDFRNCQRLLQEKLPHVGMVVSSDKGDSLNVHPVKKKEIGERLGCLALNKTYGKNILASGPLFRQVTFEKEKAVVKFDYADSLTTSDGKPLREFELAEVEGLYFPAEAEIIGDKIVVHSKLVKNPRYVRYGWKPFSRGNLVNRKGLPASTFCNE